MNEERCKRLEERQAATEERLTALESRAEGCITQDEYRARLASLRAPGVEIPSEPVDVAEMQAQIHEADMDRIAASERLNAANAALATARRERDEAVDGLRGQLAEAESKRIAAEHATGDTEEALLRVERDRDALRARLDPARGLIERAVAAMIVLAPQSPLIADLRAYLGGE